MLTASFAALLILFLNIPPDHLALAAEPPYSSPSEPGHCTVASADLTLNDVDRGKQLEVRVYYPIEQPVSPVIIFSHGAGGSRDTAGPLLSWWASHGYIVIAPTHADSIELSRRYKSGGSSGRYGDDLQWQMRRILRRIATHPADWKARAGDITFLLDNLTLIEDQLPGISGKMDRGAIGMAGHSYGAYTTMLIGGATVTPPRGGAPVNYGDDRPAALLVLSGQGVGRLGLAEDSWDGFNRPMMVMSGTEDSAAGGMDVASRRDAFDFCPPGDKYLVWITDAFHSSFTGKLAENDNGYGLRLLSLLPTGPDPEAVAGTDQVAVFDAVKAASLAYWEAYLNGSSEAAAWLSEDALESTSGADLEFSRK